MAGPLGALWHLGRALQVTTLLNAAIATSGANTASIDTGQLEGDILLKFSARTGGTNTMAVAVKDSDDDSTFAAIDASALVDPDTGAADTFASVAAAAVEDLLLVKKELCGRYLRVELTGTALAQEVCITAISREKYPG